MHIPLSSPHDTSWSSFVGSRFGAFLRIGTEPRYETKLISFVVSRMPSQKGRDRQRAVATGGDTMIYFYIFRFVRWTMNGEQVKWSVYTFIVNENSMNT